MHPPWGRVTATILNIIFKISNKYKFLMMHLSALEVPTFNLIQFFQIYFVTFNYCDIYKTGAGIALLTPINALCNKKNGFNLFQLLFCKTCFVK
jgi:hypothetical protein